MTNRQEQGLQTEVNQTESTYTFANTNNKKAKSFCWKCFGYSLIGFVVLGLGYLLVFTVIAYAIP